MEGTINKLTVEDMIAQVSPNLRIFSQHLTRNMDDAKDLYQETMVKIVRNFEKFQEGTNAKAWSITVMRNVFINRYRKKKRANTVFDSTPENFYLNSNQLSIANEGESSLEFDEVMIEIDKLKPDLKTPFLMHYQGFKYQEIADFMQLPLGTVKSKIFYARKQLQASLQHLAPPTK